MYFYFQSDFTCAIKTDGRVAAKLNVGESLRLDLSESEFLEICPTGSTESPTAFFPDEEFLSSPPENVIITDLRGGYLLNFIKRRADNGFKVLAQKKFSDMAVTVFCENGLKLSVETLSDFYAENLPHFCDSAEIKREFIDGNDAIFVLLPTASGVGVSAYTQSVGKIKKAFSREVSSCGFENGFYTLEKMKDVAKHEIKIFWNCTGSEFKERERHVLHSPKFKPELICDATIPYAFAEEFLVGGDYGFFLSDGVKKNADKLGGYFGNFIGVCVPPSFRDYREVGLIKRAGERRYSVDYFTFEVFDGKITNIKKT